MKQKPSSRRRRNSTKSVLRLPDLEHAKAAVLNSFNSTDAKRGYRHAIDEFVDWYCSEPRLAFNRIVVLRYRSYLESRLTLDDLQQRDEHWAVVDLVGKGGRSNGSGSRLGANRTGRLARPQLIEESCSAGSTK